MTTTTVKESTFSLDYLEKAESLFLRPGNRYGWEEIVSGAQLLTADGTTQLMSAAMGLMVVGKTKPGKEVLETIVESTFADLR